MNRRDFLKTIGVELPVVAKFVQKDEFSELVESSTTVHKSIAAKFNPAVGTLMQTIVEKAAPGWLQCNGAYVEVKDYPRLFLYIGDEYGDRYGWDGKSTQFRVPDYKPKDVSAVERYLIKT